MTIIRRESREQPFTIVRRATLQDERLSLEAVGLLAYLLSLPNDWQIKTTHLQKRFNIGAHKLARVLKELREAGYMALVPTRADAGKLAGSEWVLYEEPQGDHRDGSFPVLGKTETRKIEPHTEQIEEIDKKENDSAPKPRAKNPAFDAVASAWFNGDASAAGTIVQYVGLLLDDKRKLRGDWHTHRLTPPMTLDEFEAWVKHAKRDKRNAELPAKLPTSPATIARQVAEWRAQKSKPAPANYSANPQGGVRVASGEEAEARALYEQLKYLDDTGALYPTRRAEYEALKRRFE